jgi:hypothetical protein
LDGLPHFEFDAGRINYRRQASLNRPAANQLIDAIAVRDAKLTNRLPTSRGDVRALAQSDFFVPAGA